MRILAIFVEIILGILIGIILPILLILLLRVYAYIRLQMIGIHVEAIITWIETSSHGYRLFAEWHNSKTGQTYTFDAHVKNPVKFPIGSLVPAVFDPKHPNNKRLMPID